MKYSVIVPSNNGETAQHHQQLSYIVAPNFCQVADFCKVVMNELMRMSKFLRDVEVEIVPDRPSSSEVSLTVAYFMLIEDRFVNITLYIVIQRIWHLLNTRTGLH